MSEIKILKHRELYLKKQYVFEDGFVIPVDTKLCLRDCRISYDMIIYDVVIDINNIENYKNMKFNHIYSIQIDELTKNLKNINIIINEWENNSKNFIKININDFISVHEIMNHNRYSNNVIKITGDNSYLVKKIDGYIYYYDLYEYKKMKYNIEEYLKIPIKNLQETYFNELNNYDVETTSIKFKASELDEYLSINTRKKKIERLLS